MLKETAMCWSSWSAGSWVLPPFHLWNWGSSPGSSRSLRRASRVQHTYLPDASKGLDVSYHLWVPAR